MLSLLVQKEQAGPLQRAAFRGELNQDKTRHNAIMSLSTAALLSRVRRGVIITLRFPAASIRQAEER
jgi:hypothetical protein